MKIDALLQPAIAIPHLESPVKSTLNLPPTTEHVPIALAEGTSFIVPPRRRILWWPALLWSLAGLFLWLQLLNFTGRVPTPHLDSSWMAVMTAAAVQKWQFGPEIVFTYGPLAFLVTGTYTPELFWTRFFYQVIAKAFVAGLLLRVAWRLPRAEGAVFLALVVFNSLLDWETLIYVMTSWETLYFLVIGIIGLLWCRGAEDSRLDSVLAWTGIVFMASASLMKNTYLLFSVFVVGCVVLDGVLRPHGRKEMRWKVPSLFTTVILLCWFVRGQSPVNLPSYLWSAADIVLGYVSMGFRSLPLALWLSLTLGTLVLTQLFVLWVRSSERQGGLMRVILLIGALLLAWKQGFTRADAYHTQIFITYAVLAVAITPAFFNRGALPRRVHWLNIALALCLGFHGIDEAAENFWQPMPARCVERLLGNISKLTRPWTTRQRWDLANEENRQRYALPEVQAAVGRATVGVVGHEQAVAIINGLNFRVSPMIQGYQVNTPRLSAMNAKYFRSERAPDFVLFKLQAIDGRYPTLDDASVLPELWHRYHPVLVENDYLLLRRVAPPGSVSGRRLVKEGRCGFDEPVLIPPTGVFWLEMEINDTALGKLRALFYHRPKVTMRIASQDRRLARWLLPAGMARIGFMIGPSFNTTADFHRLFVSGNEGARTVGFDVHSAPEDRILLTPEISYRLYEIAPPS